MAQFNMTSESGVADIELPEDVYPPAFDSPHQPDGVSLATAQQEAHDNLLTYLLKRLDSDKNRWARTKRFARIDRMVTTWQQLSQEDSKRKSKQDATGKAQAIAMNLPLTHTHVDDMVSFFAEVFAPNSGSFFATPESVADVPGLTELVNKMNEDAASTNYYGSLTSVLRALLKYNIGGFHLEWVKEAIANDSSEQADGCNVSDALDMYNVLWDQSQPDPSKLRQKGEWAAEAKLVNRMELIRREQAGEYWGTYCILDQETDFGMTMSHEAAYYRYPPIHAGVSNEDDQISNGMAMSAIDWDAYGAKLTGDSRENIAGYELVDMYCWLSPDQFGLQYGEMRYTTSGYFLWRFKILNGQRIIFAEPVNKQSDDVAMQGRTMIPWYVGYLNYDDMKGASRSVAELLGAFQSYISFLFNAQVQGARSAIYGVKIIDDAMFDATALDQGEGTAVTLKSKQPGRDVRSGYQEFKGTYDGTRTMDQVGAVMQLVQQFFPAQALPSQVASMDRAVTSQVSAVLQGVNKRLHMLVRVLDSLICNPLRFDEYTNIVQANTLQSVKGIGDKKVRKVLGSGLESLNREIAEQSIRQVLMALIQNPQALQQYDISSIFNYWAQLQKMPIDLNQFKLEERQAPPPSSLPPGGGAAV